MVVPFVVIVAFGLFYTHRVEGRLKCQARYNETINTRTRVLTEATDLERDATRAVLDAEAKLWLNPAIGRDRSPGEPVDPTLLQAFNELRTALSEWRETVATADAQRREHPVPPPPSELCG